MRTGLARKEQLLRCGVHRSRNRAEIFRAFWLLGFASRCLSLCLLSLLLSCCDELQPCRILTTSEQTTPNGQLKAVPFRRLCPEEHSITTHVSIIRANEALPDGNGNVFGYDNEIAIRVSWLSDSRLAVYTYADPAKATKIEHAGNVSIEYSRIVETYLITPPPDSTSEGSGTPSVAKP